MLLLVKIISHLPQNYLSFLVGKLFRIQLPRKAQNIALKLFAFLCKIDLLEAKKPLTQYSSIEELFTRELKDGLRPLHKGEVISPCDGYLSQLDTLSSQGQIIQAKGLQYSPQELLFAGEKKDHNFSPFLTATIYLAPHNYHRVHSPINGELLSVCSIPGKLWPVNRQLVPYIPNLFCENERVVFELKHQELGKLYLVMVGALNVGRISSKFSSFNPTNDFPQRKKEISPRHEKLSPPAVIKKGEELGTFMLGSTVILVFDKSFEGLVSFEKTQDNLPIQLGASLLSKV